MSWIVCVCVGAAGAPPPHVRGLLSEQAEVGVHRHRVRELLRGKPPGQRRHRASKGDSNELNLSVCPPAGDPARDQLQDVHQRLPDQTHPEDHQVPAALKGKCRISPRSSASSFCHDRKVLISGFFFPPHRIFSSTRRKQDSTVKRSK